MPFKSKTEAYTYAIHELLQLEEKIHGSVIVKQAIEQIKIALENHEQDPYAVGTSKIDPEFTNSREVAWKNYMSYFSQRYAALYLPNIDTELSTRIAQDKVTVVEVKNDTNQSFLLPLATIFDKKEEKKAAIPQMIWLEHLTQAMDQYLKNKTKNYVGYARAQTIKNCIGLLFKQLHEHPTHSEEIEQKALTIISAILKRETLQPTIKRIPMFKEYGELANVIMQQLASKNIFFEGNNQATKIISANTWFETKVENVELRDNVVKLIRSLKTTDNIDEQGKTIFNNLVNSNIVIGKKNV